MDGFSSGEAARITGVPYDRLDYWARTRFLSPSIQRATGKGSDRRYSLKDLLAIRVATELRTQGISLQKLRRVVRFLQKHRARHPSLAGARLLIRGDDVLLQESEKRFIDALREPGQIVLPFVVNIGTVTTKVRAAINRLRPARTPGGSATA